MISPNSSKSYLLSAIVCCGVMAKAGHDPAYDSEYTAATGYVTMNGNDNSHTSSWDSRGNWSDGAEPHSITNYYVGSSRTLNVKHNDSGQTPGPFAGGKLVVAGVLWDYGTAGWHSILGDNVTMLPGSQYYMSSAGHIDSGRVTIKGTAVNPTLVTYSNTADKTKTFGVEFVGGEDACVSFDTERGGSPTYEKIPVEMSEFFGKICLGSRVYLRSDSTFSMPGAIECVGESGGLILKGVSGTSTVGAFSASAGSGLYLSGTRNAQVLYVTNKLSLAAGAVVKTDKFTTWSYGTPPTYPVIRLSAEAVAAGVPDLNAINAQTYSMNGRLANGIVPQLRLVMNDLEAGEKSIDETYYEVVTLTNKASYATTPFLDRSNPEWTEANDPSHYWSDGKDPSPEKDYYITDSYGVYFRASAFAGHSLILKGAVYFGIYSDVQTIPLVVTGGSRIRLMRTAGYNYVLNGTIRVEGTRAGYDLMFGAGNRSKLTVNSRLSGSADVELLLNPELNTVPANYAGTIAFEGDNSDFKGHIRVIAGKRGDFKAQFDDKGLSTWVPSSVSNVTFEVSNKANLGGALPTFTFDALAISNECRLVLNETSTFDEMTRGWLFGEKAYLRVPTDKTATVENRITYGTELVKEGAGTLMLASKPLFLTGGAASEDPNGAKLTVAEGRLGAATADAFVGLSVEFGAGTGLAVPIEGVGSARGVDLTDVTIAAPKGLPIYLDTTAVPERPETAVVTAVCTLPENSPVLAALRVGQKPYKGTMMKLEQHPNDDGTVTVTAITERSGVILIVR